SVGDSCARQQDHSSHEHQHAIPQRMLADPHFSSSPITQDPVALSGTTPTAEPEAIWRTIPRLGRFALVLTISIVSLLLLAAAGANARTAPPGDLVEVVVTLPQPPLPEAILHDRGLAAAATTHHRLNLRAPAIVSYLRTLAAAQRALQARVETAIPQARVRWHYGVVLNG